MQIKSLIDEPKQLLELIDACLKPNEIEKKKFGEVFTPMKLVNEMLDKLPSEVWNDETLKWFDPAAGMGNFSIAVYLRLMESLKDKIPNDLKRKRHILENMIYMSELNKKNCYIIEQIFNIQKKYKLNLHCGDTLKIDIKNEWNIDIFDIVIGNPPYNKELTRVGAMSLYNEFIEKFIDLCTYMIFIVPSRWFSGGKGLNKFRTFMLSRTDIKYINHFDDASKLFGKMVDIMSGVNYFLKDKNYNGDCNFNGTMVKLNKYDVFVNSKFYELIDLLTKYDSIVKLYKGRYFGIETNVRRFTDDDQHVKCYVSKHKGFIKYIDPKHVSNKRNFWKVITARAIYKQGSSFGNMFIGNLNEVYSESYISFIVENENEAESLLSYTKCKLPNLMLSLRKNSQDISEMTCKWIPLPPLDRIWADNEIYKYFKFSNKIINLIENTNIIGYK